MAQTIGLALLDILGKGAFSLMGNTVVTEIKPNVMGKITLLENGHRDHFELVKVEIVDSIQGRIDSQLYPLNHLDAEPSSHPNASAVKKLYLWRNGDIDWYIRRPSKAGLNGLRDEINAYLGFFKTGKLT
jgi:hypothetical protein